jgi:hypothetical protein
MKAMEIDSSGWNDEMRKNAVRKLEELGYVRSARNAIKKIGERSMTAYINGEYGLYDNLGIDVHSYDFTPTYEQLMAMTKEDVA